MSNELPKKLQRWENTRRKGKAWFIFLHGILGWGLPMFFLMTFIVNRHPERPFNVGMIVLPAIVWTLGGAAFGWIMWHLNENKYQKAQAGKTAG